MDCLIEQRQRLGQRLAPRPRLEYGNRRHREYVHRVPQQQSFVRPEGSENHRCFLTDLPNPGHKLYHRLELSEALVMNARTPLKDKLSGTDLDAFQELAYNHRRPTKPKSPIELLQLIEKWFPILDKVFYFGQLEKHNLKFKLGKIIGCYGYFVWFEHGAEESDYIEFSVYGHGIPCHPMPKTPDPDHHILATLAHEMLHAFLVYHSCNSSTCPNHCVKKGLNNKLKGHGKSGHGPAFILPIRAIENAFQAQLNWDLPFYIHNDICFEIETSGWIPTDCEIREWGLDPRSSEIVGFGAMEARRRLVRRRVALTSRIVMKMEGTLFPALIGTTIGAILGLRS